MNKKFLAIVIVLILLAAAVAAWYFSSPFGSELEQGSSLSLIKISAEPSLSPVNSYDNNKLWFGSSKGRLYRYVVATGELTENPAPAVVGSNFKRIYWPPQGNDYIAVSHYEDFEALNLFSAEKNSYQVLPENIRAFDWLPDGQRIAVIWKSSDGSVKLVVSNSDATGYRIVRDLPWDDMAIKVSPNGQQALLYRTNQSGEVNKIYLFSLDTGDYSDAVAQGKNRAATWLSSEKFIYSQAGEDGLERLYLRDLAQGTDRSLDLTTSLDKVFVGTTAMIAAVPRLDAPRDVFYKLDLNTLAKTEYFAPAENIRARDLAMAGGVLFFVNAFDGLIYAVQ